VYRSATAFVGPFRPTASGDQEGLGLVMVEALGCGCPVVASDIPATRDVLHGTPGCRMVKPNDADDLARCLNEVLDDPSSIQAAAREGARIMQERFDWSSVAYAYGDLIEEMAKGQPA
jgi:Glycosyltransferase